VNARLPPRHEKAAVAFDDGRNDVQRAGGHARVGFRFTRR
jgi:hypothetical protein